MEILICINKVDLMQDYSTLKEMYESIGYKIIETSTAKEAYKEGLKFIGVIGIEELKKALYKKVSVLAGPSGVGKSSITNALLCESKMEVGELSAKINRGKHTTRHAELVQLEQDSYIVDSPGFTSISIEHIGADELAIYFKEFLPYIGKCRFNDCCHINEPECAVKGQVGRTIHRGRYERYVSFYNELRMSIKER